jgi:hypothetical protein
LIKLEIEAPSLAKALYLKQGLSERQALIRSKDQEFAFRKLGSQVGWDDVFSIREKLILFYGCQYKPINP